MANEKSDMQFKTGTLKSKEVKKDNGNWKLFTLVFDIDGTEETFSCFDSIGTKTGSKSLTINDIMENKEYSIGFTETEKGKTIVYVNVPKFPKKDGNKKTQATNKYFGNGGEIKKVEINYDAEPYKEFNVQYVKLCKDAKKEINLNQYSGLFIRTFRNELGLQELALFLENEFETQVKKEAEASVYDEEIKL